MSDLSKRIIFHSFFLFPFELASGGSTFVGSESQTPFISIILCDLPHYV